MKHFIVTITYTADAETIGQVRPRHRVFLQGGIDAGMLLCSGPTAAGGGGIGVARAGSLAEVEAFYANDPYAQEGIATYTFVEFSPVLHQPLLAEWVQA